MIVEGLAHCDHHRNQHPDSRYQKHDGRDGRNDPEDAYHTGRARKPDRAEQLSIGGVGLWFRQQFRANEIRQERPDKPGNQGSDRTRAASANLSAG